MQVQNERKELDDLDRIVFEVRSYEEDNEELNQKLAQWHRERRVFEVGRWGPRPTLAEKLFGGPTPILTSGKLELTRDGALIQGVLAPGLSVDELRAALPSDFKVTTLAEKSGVVTLEAEPAD